MNKSSIREITFSFQLKKSYLLLLLTKLRHKYLILLGFYACVPFLLKLNIHVSFKKIDATMILKRNVRYFYRRQKSDIENIIYLCHY